MPVRTAFTQITVPNGQQTTPKNNGIQIPAGTLQGASEWLSSLSVGPVQGRLDVGVSADTYVQLTNAGWMRSDGVLNGSDAITWVGSLDIAPGGAILWPYARNDTGAAISITVGYWVAVP